MRPEDKRFEIAIVKALRESAQTRAALHGSLGRLWSVEADEVIGRALQRLKRRGIVRASNCVWSIVE